MRIFVINLAKNAERLRKVDDVLVSLRLPYERVDAVYGAGLSESERRLKCNYFRWWCESGCWPRPGEIGAALSHLSVYRKMIDENIPFCAIFEDDISPDNRLARQLQSVEDWLSPDVPQVVLLSNYTRENEEEWTIVPTQGDSSAEAYVITKSAAKVLLLDNMPVYHPSDVWRKMVKWGLIRVYHAYPVVIHPAWRMDCNYKSDVTPDNTVTIVVAKMGPIGKFIWKLKRIVGMVLSRIIWSCRHGS